MKNIKKFAALLAAITLVFMLGSCQTNIDEEENKKTTTEETKNPAAENPKDPEPEKSISYTITIVSEIEHGSVSVNTTSAEAGTVIKLTATPDSYFMLDAYSVKDSSENVITVANEEFSMPASNVTISATFKPKETIAVSANNLSTLAETLTAIKNTGIKSITLKLTDMIDGNSPNASGIDDWKDPRFTAILEAICDAQGLSVNLDLSETNITFIPSCAFSHDNPTTYNPVNLTGIILPKTLTKIIQFAFESTSFKKITIPASVIAIGRNAFENSGLEEITFEKNSALGNIGQNAFHNSNLKSITLPESLQDIQDNAFDACSKLDTINYEGTAEWWAYIYRGDDWHKGIKATTVKCSDYTVPLDLSPVDFEGLIGTKPASIAKEVGDIVFSDGSATPYSEDLELTQSQKDNAVAVIFYVGTGLNSENDNSTKRTLGVGFNTASDYNWCSEEANACELSIDTIKCEPDDCYPSYRRFYFKDKTANDKNGSDNLKQIGEFLTANGKENDTDDSSKYPAFYFAKNYNAPGNQYDDGWYLPSLAEFFELYDIRFIDDEGDDINVVFKLVTGKDPVFDYQNGFWTSTQASGDEDNTAYAFVEYYAGIYSSATSKFDYFNVCAIREF